MPQQTQPKTLPNHTIVLMIVTALFFDIFQWLLAFVFMDWLVSIFAFMTFTLWFMLKGIKLLKPKRALTLGGGFLIEMFPFLAILPGWTISVTITALDAKIKNITSGASSAADKLSEYKTRKEAQKTGENKKAA